MVRLSELEAPCLSAKANSRQSTVAAAPLAKWPSSEADWEKHKVRIKQLYLEEDKPLKEVMAIMETNHLFRAS